jgi:hypothetical protein
MVHTIHPRGRREFVPRGDPPHREGGRRVGFGSGEFAGRPLLVANTSMGGTIAVVGLQGDVRVFHLGEIGWILLTPRLSKWRGTGLIHFVLTLVLSPLLTLTLVFDFAGGRLGGFLVDRLRLLSTHDRRSTVVLQPHPGVDQGVHHFWG